jgi:hypothetical protein
MENGCPCKNLKFFEYTGLPWLDIRLLALLGWGKQYNKFRKALANRLLYGHLTEKAKLELMASKKKLAKR